MQWWEAMLCCRRWRQHRVVNGSICFPPLEWTHCLVTSWVIASPLERQAEEEQKRMYISKSRTGNPRRTLSDWTIDDLANVSWDVREGIKVRRILESSVHPFLPEWTPAWTVSQRGAGSPTQKQSCDWATLSCVPLKPICSSSPHNEIRLQQSIIDPRGG